MLEFISFAIFMMFLLNSHTNFLWCFSWIHRVHIFLMFLLNSHACTHTHSYDFWWYIHAIGLLYVLCFYFFLNWQQRQCVYVEWENHLSRFKGKHKHVNAFFLVPLLPPICLVPLFPQLGLGVQAFSFSFGLIFLCIVSLPSFVAVGSIMY